MHIVSLLFKNNGRAELAVKTVRRILFDKTVNADANARIRLPDALLTHRNTSVQDLDMSLAVLLTVKSSRIISPLGHVLNMEAMEGDGNR